MKHLKGMKHLQDENGEWYTLIDNDHLPGRELLASDLRPDMSLIVRFNDSTDGLFVQFRGFKYEFALFELFSGCTRTALREGDFLFDTGGKVGMWELNNAEMDGIL